MKIEQTNIDGLLLYKPDAFNDPKGQFVKTYSNSLFQENGLDIDILETYYSISNKNVIRGMHFQAPPHDHVKLVYVPFGKIIDVVLDIRKNSKTYGKYFSMEISCQNKLVLIIPSGCAHGFKSLEDNTNVTYMQTTVYEPDFDQGIKYDSFDFDWEIKNPELSSRDQLFANFDDFKTLFVEGEQE